MEQECLIESFDDNHMDCKRLSLELIEDITAQLTKYKNWITYFMVEETEIKILADELTQSELKRGHLEDILY